MVSVVILSWNGGDDLYNCVQHVLAQSYAAIELIIVDNGSTDGSLEPVLPLLGERAVLRNASNLGYARGMNQGIALAHGEYILLLNQDAFAAPDFVEQGVRAFEADDGVGMVAATVLAIENGNRSEVMTNAGIFLRKRMKPRGNKDREATRVLGPSWCSAFARRAMLEDVKCPIYGDYLDEDYFSYQEDVDFSLRMALRGWSCVYVPELRVWHLGSGSFGGERSLVNKPPYIRRHALKNRYLTIVKNMPLELLLLWSFYLVIAEIGLWMYLGLKSPSTLGDLFSAYIGFVRLLPKAIRRRKAIQARRIISVGQLRRLFVGF